jgi:hypothetical protein
MDLAAMDWRRLSVAARVAHGFWLTAPAMMVLVTTGLAVRE